MASGASNYLEGSLLNNLLRGTTYTWPTNIYAALLTDSNTAAQRRAGTVTEVSTGTWTNYARITVAVGTATFAAAAGDPRACVNSGAAIAFGTAATTGNVTCNALAFYDASSAGNLLLWFDLTAPAIVANGNVVSVATSALTISLT